MASETDPPARTSLVRFRVRFFRSVIDSGAVPVFPVTALIGRNESGKTSLLRALAGIDPRARSPYSIDRDWPTHIGKGRSSEQVVCRAEYALAPRDGELFAAAGGLVEPIETVLVDRHYGGRFEVRLPAPAPDVEDPEREAREALREIEPLHGAGSRTFNGILRALRERRARGFGAPADLDEARVRLDRLLETPLWLRHRTPERKRLARRVAAAIETLTASAREVRERRRRLRDAAERLLPPVVHLEEQGLLGLVLEWKAVPDETGTETSDSCRLAERAFWRVSGLDPASGADPPDPRRLARAVDRLHTASPSAAAADLRLHAEHGRLRLHHTRSNARAASEQRGGNDEFQWHFTLDLLLADRAPDDRRPRLILLDAPGRILGGSQAVRTALEAYRSRGTIIYTAILPFPIDLQHPEQILVLAPTREGPVVRPESDASRATSLPSLRAALGITGRSSFRISDLNLVVEGPSDVNILRALSALMERSGESGLPHDLHPAPAGGSHEVTHVAIFLAQLGLGVIALYDSDEAGDSARHALEDQLAEGPGDLRVLVHDLAAIAGIRTDDCAIEDLFPVPFYLEAVREVCATVLVDRPLAPSSIPRERKITAVLRERFAEWGERFPKGHVAEELVRQLEATASVDELPSPAPGRVRAIFRALARGGDLLRGRDVSHAGERWRRRRRLSPL